MTIKEKLYKEYVIAQNKVNTLCNKELIGGENVEEYFATNEFRLKARNYTKEELNDKIRWAKAAYDEEVEKLRIENYYNTPEGALEKANLTSAISELQEKRGNLFHTTTESVDTFIKEWLGEEWGCGLVGSSNVEIGIVEKKVNDANWMVFGHTFTLYYNDYFKKDRFEVNYGCMGSFEVLNGDGALRCKYLRGMAEFVNNKEKLQTLKNMLDEHCSTIYKLEKQLDVLKYNLSHPFDKRKVA